MAQPQSLFQPIEVGPLLQIKLKSITCDPSLREPNSRCHIWPARRRAAGRTRGSAMTTKCTVFDRMGSTTNTIATPFTDDTHAYRCIP